MSTDTSTTILMPRPVPVFTGGLIRMRPMHPDQDAKAYFQFSQDPELHHWTGNTVLPTVAAAKEELRLLAENPHLSSWLIVDRPGGELAGRFFLCLHQRQGQRVVGEGNRIARKFWRQGHNRQARAFLFRYAFESLHADVYETEVWQPNTNSVQSIEAHGFRFLWQEDRLNPKYRATFIVRHYAMTAENWRWQHQRDAGQGSTAGIVA